MIHSMQVEAELNAFIETVRQILLAYNHDNPDTPMDVDAFVNLFEMAKVVHMARVQLMEMLEAAGVDTQALLRQVEEADKSKDEDGKDTLGGGLGGL